MKPLSIHDSGNLFFNRVFGSEQQCPDELKEVSYGIVRACCGLPLSLIHVAGLLASIDYSELWHHVHDRLCYILDRNHTIEEIQKKILNFSYNSLPHCLKTCLLYYNMYPEGYIMWKVHLVKQWIAEGFINAAEGKDREEIAEGYFEELVNRGMVQPMKIDHIGEVLSCTVHHIIVDIINHNSKEDDFIAAIDYSQPITGLSTKAHRLSFRFSSAKYAKQPAGIAMSQLRSVGFFGLLKCMPPVVEFKHLRVLILEFWGNHDGHMSLNLSRICVLFQLRYLKISSDVMVELPEQMQGLHCLETLEIDARVSAVPFDIVRLPSLLHLGLRDATKLPDEIGRIKSLTTLWYYDLKCNSEDNIRSLGQLTNLQHLHLTCSAVLSSDDLKRKLIPLAFSLGKLGNLKSLTLTPDALRTGILFYASSGISFPSIFLQRLEMLPPVCFFSRLPTQIGQLHKLRILKIVVKELKGDDIKNIAGLPSLEAFSLYVRTALTGTVIFSTMAFPALKYFKFTCGVISLAFQVAAMPNIQRLKLYFNAHRGENHSGVVDGIEHLLNLREVAGRIGVLPGDEEFDRRVVMLSFEDAIRKHPRCPIFNLQLVDFIVEEWPCSLQALDKLYRRQHDEHEVTEKDCAEDTNKHVDSSKAYRGRAYKVGAGESTSAFVPWSSSAVQQQRSPRPRPSYSLDDLATGMDLRRISSRVGYVVGKICHRRGLSVPKHFATLPVGEVHKSLSNSNLSSSHLVTSPAANELSPFLLSLLASREERSELGGHYETRLLWDIIAKDTEIEDGMVEAELKELRNGSTLTSFEGFTGGPSSLSMTSDGDTSSTTTGGMFTSPDGMFISSNGKLRRKIKSWTRGSLLGSGSLGVVYEGMSDEGAFFAVKEISLHAQGSNAQQLVLALEQDISLLSQFEHRNIVQYYGTDKISMQGEWILYIFTELVTQGSLSSLYMKYKLREVHVSAYTRQILNGLVYLHERNVIHRDIKCSNILLHANGTVKLADFGLAKMFNFNAQKLERSVRWMAPEVVNPKKTFGLPADIWSLGCTVLEMLTRQIPFPSLEWTQALYKIGRGEPPLIPKNLSKEAQDFICQCVRVDPETWPSASQLLEHPFVTRPRYYVTD